MIYENVHTSKEAKEVLCKKAHNSYCRYQSMLTEKEKKMNDIMTYKVTERFYNEANVNVNVAVILVASNHYLVDDTTLKSLEPCNDVSNAVQTEITLALWYTSSGNFEDKVRHGILNIENFEKYKYISLFDSRGDLIMCVDTAELEEAVEEEYNAMLEAFRDDYEELSAAAVTEESAEAYVESCKHGRVVTWQI